MFTTQELDKIFMRGIFKVAVYSVLYYNNSLTENSDYFVS